MRDLLDEKNLNEDDDEKAFCFLANPDKSYIDLVLQDQQPTSLSFASSPSDGITWVFESAGIWKLEAFKIDLNRVSANTLECKWQSVSKNITAYNMKRAGIQFGGQKQPFCYFDITLISSNGYPIFGGQFIEFAAIFAKCTSPSGLSIWERITTVNSHVDLAAVKGLRVSFNAASKCCRC